MLRATGDARPKPVWAQLGLQDGPLGRVPHQGVDPRGEPLHPVHEQDRVHLGRCGEQRPGRLTKPRQQGVEQTEEGRGSEPGDAIEGLGGAAAPDQTGDGLLGYGFAYRQGQRGPGRQGLVGRTQGRGGHPGDVRPVPVSRAQGIGPTAPGRTRQGVEYGLHARGFARSDPQQGLGDLPLRRQEVGFPIDPGEGRNLGIAPGRQQPHRPAEGGGRIGECRQGVAAVVLAVAEGADAVLPRLAPVDAGQGHQHPAGPGQRRRGAPLQAMLFGLIVIDARCQPG